MKKAFFFDIDGTLVYPENGELVVSEKNKQAITELRAKGYKTFIATGRTQGFVPDVVNKLPMDGFITANGSVVRIGDELIYEKLFPKAAIQCVIQFCIQMGYNWMFEGNLSYIDDLNSPAFNNFNEKVIIIKEKIFETENIYDKVLYNALILGDDLDVEALRKCLGPGYIAAPHPKHGYIDCYLEGNTKADGIDKVIKHLGLDDYETYAFGDGNNDLEMFDRVDVAVAMGNATPELKDKASMITESNDIDGVYHGLKKLGFIY